MLFTSCERDSLETVKEWQPPKIRGKHVKIQDLLAQPKLAAKLTALSQNGLAKSTNLAGIQIDTTNIRAIESDNYISYTFQIVQDSIEKQTMLKNYILTIVNDSLEIQHLVNYNVLSKGVYDMNNIQLERVYGDSLRSQFAKCGGQETQWYIQTECYVVQCRGEDLQGNPQNHGMNDGCRADAESQPYWNCVNTWASVTVDEPDCATISDDQGSPSGGYTPNNNTRVNIPVDPFNPTINPIASVYQVTSGTQEFFNTLNQHLQDFLNNTNQNQLRQEIDDFLDAGLYSPSDKAFALQVIKAKEESEDAEVDYENKSIYKANVPECLKEIINKLKPTESFNVNFAGVDARLLQQMQLPNIILDLFNNDAGYSLTIETGDLPPDPITGLRPNAQTSSPVPSTVPASDVFNITISLNNNYLDSATDLAIARTMIHELIHAYFSYLRRSQPQSDIASQLQILMNDATLSPVDPEHTVMASSFVNSIANALGVWDNYSIPVTANNGVDFDGTPFDYYQLLSWSGDLTGTTYYISDKSADFQFYSLASRKAEEGIRNIRDTFILSPKGINNCD